MKTRSRSFQCIESGDFNFLESEAIELLNRYDSEAVNWLPKENFVREWVTMDFKVVVSLWLGDSIVWKLVSWCSFTGQSGDRMETEQVKLTRQSVSRLPLVRRFNRMETARI
jgi:hypothetical protein